MRTTVLGAVVSLLLLWLAAGCCTPRSGCNNEPDPTAQYQVQPAEYQRAMRERAAAKASAQQTRPTTQPAALQVLVLSGGGSNGAYGAGFLSGWSKTGQRPKFDVVTGVSTGAILSTGALLGNDELLTQMFTHVSDRDIQEPRWLPFSLFSNSLRSSAPLRHLLGKYLTEQLIDDVARVSRDQHRQLFIATTNLDSGRLTIWDMTRIAGDRQYKLYRDVVYASASPPILFPPVNIGGHLHVDGNTRASHFFRSYLLGEKAIALEAGGAKPTTLPGPITPPTTAPAAGALRQPTVYVIINGSIGLGPDCPCDRLSAISLRAIDCLLDANAVASLYETRYFAKGFDLKYTRTPSGTAMPAFEFKQPKMAELYKLGFEHGERVDWSTDLPDADLEGSF